MVKTRWVLGSHRFQWLSGVHRYVQFMAGSNRYYCGHNRVIITYPRWTVLCLKPACNYLDHGKADKYISKFYSNIYPTRCNVTQFIFSGNCSTCFGWYHYPSSGAQTTVSTAFGICHTVTAICRYRGKVETTLSVLWVA